jgi:ribosome-binding factor A
MESKRQKQVGRLIQKDLGDIFQKEFRALFSGNFVTITDVKVSPDLSVAKVYLSFLKTDNREALLQEIRENTKKIRGQFGAMAGKQLRIIPHFTFFRR